jgi:hypothetical protein
MAGDLLAQLRAIDPAVLTGVVRQDQCDPHLAILNWTVEPINHEKLIDTTAGLFRFSGESQGVLGRQSWAVVLKCIHNPIEESQQPREYSYWRREITAFQSGLLAQLPTGVRAPRCYEVMENEDGAWVWIEYIQETTGKQWSLDYFRRAARKLGRFQGAYLCGTPLPDYPWLCQPFFSVGWTGQGGWPGLLDPEFEQKAWKSPVVQSALDDRQKFRVLQLLVEKLHFDEVNYRLPQVLCHNDVHRKNFMWTQSPQNGDFHHPQNGDFQHTQTGEEELIALDWAFTGPGGLGNDLGELLGNSLYFFDYDPQDVETFESALLDGYLTGIADNRVRVDPRLVRLGYLISLSFWMATLPGWTPFRLPPESGSNVQAMNGHSAEEVLAGWVHLNAFCLDRADEARRLIQQLDL